jgi:endoglucanase
MLSEAPGVSGYEGPARELVRSAFAPYADELRTDALGNLIALRKGRRAEGAPARSIMLAAHVDEIGLMVTALEGASFALPASAVWICAPLWAKR